MHRYYFFVIVFALLFANRTTLQAQDKPAADTANTIPDTLLFKLQQAQSAVTAINAANKKGYNTGQVKDNLAEIRKNIQPVKRDLSVAKKVIDSKSLLSYNLILKDAQEKLTALQQTLSKSNRELQQRADQVMELSNDSLLRVERQDTSGKELYTHQLSGIRQRLQAAGKATNSNLDTVSRLLASVSDLFLTVSDLQNSINERLQQTGQSMVSREVPYLWQAPATIDPGNILGLASASFQGQGKILSYFIDSGWDNRVLLILVVAGLYYWVHRNFNKAALAELRDKIGILQLEHLSPYPVVASLIVMLNLVPLFEPDSPSLYIEITQFLLLILLTIHFWKRIAKTGLKYWLFIAGVFVVIQVSTAVIYNNLWMRLWLMALNVTALYVGTYFIRRLRQLHVSVSMTKPVLLLFWLFNGLAILLNLFGRISLAKIYTSTAIIGLTQVLVLAVFIQILTDAIELHIRVSACSAGLFSRVNVRNSRVSFRRALLWVAAILWLLVLVINLSIAGGLYAFVQQVLVKPRTFGSVSFTLGNILFFAVIVYVSNLLQKHIGVLFGESDKSFADKTEHKGSKLALIRLIIIIIGILLAFMASGLPLDKITVVLGALSVGIGLGMQNIVNNFVSGIILIFEKPFRIGDYIELADKKGKVQDIGIRSSKMLTPQGSEVIIPNGDLLSGRLVNWTLSNDYLKTEIIFKVSMASDIEAISKMIKEEVEKAEDTVKNLPPEILINTILLDAVELKVLVWITNIYAEAAFKSRLLNRLLIRFREAEIKVM